jgi:anti-repressor protein
MKLVVNELIPVYETDQGEHVVDGRELHQFLEIGKDFSTWIKDRLEKYDFEDGIDYTLTLTKIGERQNVTRHDYILKLDTAKEIAMVESNITGSKVRKYFIAVEKRFKNQLIDVAQLSPELQMFKQIWDGQARAQLEQAETQRQLALTNEKVNLMESAVSTIKDTIVQRDDDWRNAINKMFNNAAMHTERKDFQALRNESYKMLEDRAHCDIDKRLRNLVDRLKQSGATKTQISKASKLDVIEADPRLKEIYTSIVKELSVRHVKIGA